MIDEDGWPTFGCYWQMRESNDYEIVVNCAFSLLA